MKKLLFVFVSALFITSCSTDSIDEASEHNTAFTASFEKGSLPCFASIEGEVTIDASAGINNPNINFTANVVQGAYASRKSYTMNLYLQPIADCEDLTSGVGDPILFTKSVSVSGLVPPTITLKPANLPSGCYTWMIEIVGAATLTQGQCVNRTMWYDAPLF